MILVLLLCCVSAEFSMFSVDLGGDLSILSPSGSKTTIATLPSGIDLADASVTADVASGIAYVAASTKLLAVNISSGILLQQTVLPSGGSLRHIAYDYKHAAAGAPGHSLYGLWETSAFEVSLVMINKGTFAFTTVSKLNTTGHVTVAYLGLPKPQFGEPEGKHYGVVVTPAGSNAASGDVVTFLDLRGTYHHWGYVERGVNATAIAMNYDTHNCYITFSSGGKTSFAIMHMLGKIQEVLSHSDATSYGNVDATTIDMGGGIFYTVQEESGVTVLTGLNLRDGRAASSSKLSFRPVALCMNETPL